MKLCIVGPEKRTESDIRILKTAKNYFDSVLYVPYSNISFSIEDRIKVKYKNINLANFDVILPRIGKKRNLLAYILLSTLKLYSPYSPQSFFITSDRFLMMDILKREGISVPNIYSFDSIPTGSKFLDILEYPFSLRMSGDEEGITFANTKKEAKTILDTLGSFKRTIYLEEFFKEKYYQAYVIGGKVVAAMERNPEEKSDIFFGKGKVKKTRLSREMETLAITSASAIKADFVKVDMIKNPKRCVINMDLNPSIIEAMELTKFDIDNYLINYIHSFGNITKKPALSWLKSFLEDTRSRVKDILPN